MQLPYDTRLSRGARPQPFNHTATSVAAGGVASVSFTPDLGQTWQVELLTVTSLKLAVTVTHDGQVIDSTTGDRRATVTSNSTYTLRPGEQLLVSWATSPSATLTDGTVCKATVTGHWTS